MEYQNMEEATRNLQRYLRQLSYENKNITSPPIDGFFDNATRSSLIDFQKMERLPATGRADRTTWDLLYLRYLQSLERNSPPTSLMIFPRAAPDYSIGIGDESFLVQLLQYILSELNVIYDGYGDVEQTGIYNENDKALVQNFQKKHSLPQTGEVDRTTWNALANVFNRSFGNYQRQ